MKLYFADNTCLLNIEDSVKQINKVVNKDLKFLVQWLKANKISLNVAKATVSWKFGHCYSSCDIFYAPCGDY